jgi:serine/threonine-protein kinase
MLQIGTIIADRYEVIDTVGSGGMSVVYKALDHRLNRNVAIKVLKEEFSNDKTFVSKFRVEAQSAAGLSHPNIVNVFDVGDVGDIHYIVMELVEGITLKEYIQRKGHLSVSETVNFTLQIASGIEVAHDNHIIHRDIKPQNIIVSPSGILKVMDFGIAKAATSATISSNAIGSVHYISPEQARGGFCDERSDIYSLGITMYEMITGRVPFEGDNNVAVALMHIQNEMIPPTEYYPDILPSLEKVIFKCTEKKPERRYLTANALIADLRRVEADPTGSFVKTVALSDNAPTRAMTDDELSAIKSATAVGAGAEPGDGEGPGSGAPCPGGGTGAPGRAHPGYLSAQRRGPPGAGGHGAGEGLVFPSRRG